MQKPVPTQLTPEIMALGQKMVEDMFNDKALSAKVDDLRLDGTGRFAAAMQVLGNATIIPIIEMLPPNVATYAYKQLIDLTLLTVGLTLRRLAEVNAEIQEEGAFERLLDDLKINL